ncbi:hypothetical protein ACE6H2_025242 [Prunus campanulata]
MEVDRDLIDEGYIDYIRTQWRKNNSKYTVMGSRISFYNFVIDYASGKQHYDGELFFKESKQGGIPVTFMNMDAKAGTKLSGEEIFRLDGKVSNKRILRPFKYTFCKQKSFNDKCSEAERDMMKGCWTLCYDKFDYTLDEWVLKLQKHEIRDPGKFKLIAGSNCLSDFWRRTIRELIKAIAQIHDCGLFHGSLAGYNNYVVVGDQLKLFNIGGCLESVHDQHSRKIQDFQEFRDTLKMLLAPSFKQWPERDRFLNCFDDAAKLNFCYEDYVKKLKRHPFLLTPRDRVIYVTSIYHNNISIINKMMNIGGNFQAFYGWNKDRDLWDKFLRDIYESRESKSYDHRPSELLRFMRNTYEHYRKYTKKKIEEVDAILRKRWDGFFELVHLIKFGEVNEACCP